MKKAHKELISSLKLFEGCREDIINNTVICRGYTKTFKAGEAIEADNEPSMGVLLSGRAVIFSSDQGKRTLLRFVSPGNAVGVASLFSTDPPNTLIEACGDGKTEMFFISREIFEDLLADASAARFRINLITFLADRVSFLNSKIDSVTAGSAERKLAVFIRNSPIEESGDIDIGMSATALARALDIGRASLYRALDLLEDEEIIKRDGKNIKLISSEKLNEIILKRK